MGAKHYLTLRAFSQLFLTTLTLGTSITAFSLTLLFQQDLDYMNQNFRNSMTSNFEPCIRNTNPDCGNAVMDTCWVAKPWCCPEGYSCQRSPVVGLYCKHGAVDCGNFTWCRDFADISGQCRTSICQKDLLVEKMTGYAFVMAAMGVLLDIVDIVAFAACQDSVVFKSVLNIMSSCTKWVAFGIIVGSGAKEFMTELYVSRCYNKPGMDMVDRAGQTLVAFILMEVGSAVLSLVLAPLSAYYGGKLMGVPHVK
jgi:hypothetical protein